MTYKFEPFIFSFNRQKYPKAEFVFNLSSYNCCADSHGLYIYIQIAIYYKISICLKPFGEITFNKD